MKLIVFSDTHGNYPLAIKAMDGAGHSDIIIHLGDEVEDARILAGYADCPVVAVAGNCDRDPGVPRELFPIFDGIRFFLTHGDAYGVKGGLRMLHARALREEVLVVLYGHTHRCGMEVIDGIHYINPGTLRSDATNRSYATISIESGKITAELIAVP